ncbi:MAG: HAMP domain-containing histidine kinase [Myxococcales bacterium]|nr:HAMP domain-containing histidine kinase [Myxococcales bacterium]
MTKTAHPATPSLRARAAGLRRWLAEFRALRPAGRRLVVQMGVAAGLPALTALLFGRWAAAVVGIATGAVLVARLRMTFVDPLAAFAARINRSDPPDNPPLDEVNRRDELGELSRALDSCHQRLARHDEESAGFARALALRLRGLAESAAPGPGEDAAATLGKSLRALADDLEDLGWIPAKRRPDGSPATPLAELAAEVLGNQEAFARERGVTLRLRADPSVPAAAIDAARARRVLDALLTGAIAVSRRDQAVVVTLTAIGGHALLTVRDDGPSVPEFQREEIFGRHHAAEAGSPADRRGAGLPLAVARAIVARAGGRIWLTRGLRGGAVVSVSLPTTARLHSES